MSGELTLYSQGSLKKSGRTQLSNFVCWWGGGGGGSLCHRQNLIFDKNIGKAVLRYIFWAPNRLDELLEVRFKFPFMLIGKLTMAFLTGQSLSTYTCILKSSYTGWCLEQGFQRCFADGLNQSSVSPVGQARSGDGLYMYSKACQ